MTTAKDQEFTIQASKGRLRLNVGSAALATAMERSGRDEWAIYVYVPDLDGRRMHGSGTAPSRAEARRRLTELAPTLLEAQAQHQAVAAALGTYDYTDSAPFQVAIDAVRVGACTFVRLLARAARGDAELEATLRRGKHPEIDAAADAIASARESRQAARVMCTDCGELHASRGDCPTARALVSATEALLRAINPDEPDPSASLPARLSALAQLLSSDAGKEALAAILAAQEGARP